MRKYILGAFIALSVMAIAACGGGGGNNNAIITYPTPSNVSEATLTASGATISLPSATGLAVGTVKVSGSGEVSASQSTTVPTGVAALQTVVRTGPAKIASTSRTAASATNSAVAYVTVTAGAATSVSQILLTVSPTGSIPSGTYYLAFWNGSQWVTIGTPATISGSVITVNSGSLSPAASLSSGSSYYLAVYTGQIFTTPTPEPAKPVAAPSAVTLSESTQTTICVTTNPGLTITASGYDATLVTVSPSPSATAAATVVTPCTAAGQALFVVTANASKVGTTTITFTDPINQSTQVPIVVNDTYNTPAPNPSAATIGLSSIAAVALQANANEQVTISSGSSSATLNTSNSASGATSSITLTTNSTGAGTFYVVGAAPGYATISLADTHSNVGSLQVNVSAVTNGNLANGSTAWTPCSYVRPAALAAPVNAASPAPNTPEPAQATPTPAGGATPIPASSASALVAVAAPPNNDNPGWSGYSSSGVTDGGGSVTYNQSNGTSTITTTITTGTGVAPPTVVGSSVLLLGSIGNAAYPNMPFGACQSLAVPTPPPGMSGGPYLSFYVLEGGGEYTFKYADQEAAIFPTPLPSPIGIQAAAPVGTPSYLFAEQNCYVHPSDAGSPTGIWGASITSSGVKGCWPSTYGGDPSSYNNWLQGGFWKPMGPYDLSSYAGQTITLFLGNWSDFSEASHTYELQFMYVGDIQT
ncbi:MAG: hypothetical protein WBG27_10800, partial [Candidatus Aquilonibacter sp.]